MIGENEYAVLLENIHNVYGYDFRDYAEGSVKRRILYYMTNKNIGTIHDLERRLLSDEAMFEEFVQELSVTVTEMFRDPSFYRQLREVVLPRLATYPFIKIWIAGCATGQEAYSVSIILREDGLAGRSLIYATDINQRSLKIATDGIYALENMQLYTDNYIRAGGRESFSKYYRAKYNGVLFDKTLRDIVVFSPHNLVTDQSFNEFQLIICRNVIMYFNQELQNKVVKLFAESLCQFGFLAFGDKESLLLNENKTLFEEIDRKEKIYRKIR